MPNIQKPCHFSLIMVFIFLFLGFLSNLNNRKKICNTTISKLHFTSYFHIYQLVIFPSLVVKIQIFNVNLSESFILNLIADMHGQSFITPLSD
jgi:cytochrome bd-type quinol oxidase subunit 2